MVASNRNVDQTGNDFIISEQHLIMQLFLHSYGQLVLNNNTDAQQV
jgi:hypothetical protein